MKSGALDFPHLGNTSALHTGEVFSYRALYLQQNLFYRNSSINKFRGVRYQWNLKEDIWKWRGKKRKGYENKIYMYGNKLKLRYNSESFEKWKFVSCRIFICWKRIKEKLFKSSYFTLKSKYIVKNYNVNNCS